MRTHQVEYAQPPSPAEQQRRAAKRVARDAEERELVIHAQLAVRPVTHLQAGSVRGGGGVRGCAGRRGAQPLQQLLLLVEVVVMQLRLP